MNTKLKNSSIKGIIDTIKEDMQLLYDEAHIEGYKEGYKVANKEKKLDILGFNNINFSCNSISKYSDITKYRKQRLTRGFDDTETWNLDKVILRFILPRLKVFKEQTNAYPPTFKNMEEWQHCLNKMIHSIESIIEDKDPSYEGWELFKDYFFDLWW